MKRLLGCGIISEDIVIIHHKCVVCVLSAEDALRMRSSLHLQNSITITSFNNCTNMAFDLPSCTPQIPSGDLHNNGASFPISQEAAYETADAAAVPWG